MAVGTRPDALRDFLREAAALHSSSSSGKADGEAKRHLKDLVQNTWRSEHAGKSEEHGYGTWGYSVLRTVYTPESDQVFPEAIAKLKQFVHYRLHSDRFPMFGVKGERDKKTDPIYNDELWRRFHFDILEDADGLSADSDDPFLNRTQLCNYFKKWVASKGGDPEEYGNPRFWDCLVIDEESMKSLLALPDETPPLRVAVDNAEKAPWREVDAGAFVWILDSRAGDGIYEGRMLLKAEISDIQGAWFWRMDHTDGDLYSEEREQDDGTISYWFGPL